MNVLINHCWCSDSIWGGVYDCQVIVSLEQYATREDIYAQKSTPDWENILDKHEFRHDKYGDGHIIDEETYRLKPEVQKWLEENVKDRNCKPWGDRTETSLRKGWGVGTDKYNSNSSISFTLFFERPKDAMAFIKRWSIYKKPVSYLNYFKDIRRELDMTTLRLKRVPR